MPEGPEIIEFTRRVNDFAKGRIFNALRKPTNHRSVLPSVIYSFYRVSAKSRGKEFIITMTETDSSGVETPAHNKTCLLMAMGMSGHIETSTESDIPKHSHLQFVSGNDVLSYVDARRFGSFSVVGENGWGELRGPDPIYEYDLFRGNILSNLANKAFDRPVCEVLLNQEFFNGVGNYLRAEILCRSGIPPFVSARDAIEKSMGKETDLLKMTHTINQEVIEKGLNKDYPGRTNPEFNEWLSCYSKGHYVDDSNKRRIWFWGSPGPLLKGGKYTRSKAAPPSDMPIWDEKSTKAVGKIEKVEEADEPREAKPKKTAKGRKRTEENTPELVESHEEPQTTRITRSKRVANETPHAVVSTDERTKKRKSKKD